MWSVRQYQRRKSGLSASTSENVTPVHNLTSPSQASSGSLWSSVKQAVRSHMDRSTKPLQKDSSQVEQADAEAALVHSPAATQQLHSSSTGAFKLQPPPHAAETGAATPVLVRNAAPPNQAAEADGSRRASDASSVASVCSMALAYAPTAEFASAQMSQHNLLFEEQRSVGLPRGGMAGAQSNPLYDDATLRLTPREHIPAAATVFPVTREVVAAPPPAAAKQLPAAAPSTVVAARAAAGQLPRVDEASSMLTAYAPGGLSVLYENQTMRVERVELKAELKLISARLAVLEARSKAWGRTVPTAAKGRSQSAPRGAPRHRQAPQRSAPAIAEAPEQGTNGKASAALRAGRSLQRASAVAPRTASTDSVRAAASRPAPTPKVPIRAARSVARSRPGSPARPAVHVAFGSRAASRASSPARPATAKIGSRRSSPVRPGAGRPAAKPSPAVPFGSRVCSPVRGATAPRLAFGSRAGSPAHARSASAARSASSQQSDSAATASSGAAAMPYRNAFMGGHNASTSRRPRDTSPASSQGSRASVSASASEGNAASRPPMHAGGVDSSFGPPPPRRSAAACPSSEERWAGPGGRLGRAPLQTVEVGVPSAQHNKENARAPEGTGKVSRVALTAAKLGLTLDNAFKPRQAGGNVTGA
ncbi:hypothetical protein WJX75_000277 [Coccomyxa subellipsoidea]|uniref:Uncharacterized protein n=1 Tax=Coccomyxa subellipsoidea TaxID=248742 RepID=A0ABR2Z0C9_9CHLO